MGKSAKALKVSAEEKELLEKTTKARSAESRTVNRARLILMASQGISNQEISIRLGIHRNHVTKWRQRFEANGIDGLTEGSRSGMPAIYTKSDKQRIVTKVCTKPAAGLSRWSVRSLAKATGTSASFTQRVLKEHDLHPHRLRTFNFSPDPQFEEKLLEVVGLYMNPPQNALVLCMDEKTGIQALDRTQPVLPLRSKKPMSWSNEYVRHGTRTMLAAVEIQSGRATTWVNKTRKAVDFVKFMEQVVKEYPNRRLHVVMDNLNTHKGALAKQWLEKNPLVSFHYTPTHASWVNLAECFFSILTRKGLQHSVHRSTAQLTKFLKQFVNTYNKDCGPFVWTKGPLKLKRIIELTQAFQNTKP